MGRRGGRRAWCGSPRVLTAAEMAALPLTRRRVAAIAAAAEAASDAEEGHAPINISSESDAGESEESGSEEEDGEEEEDDGEEPSGDEDYIDISDSGESCVDISDSGEIYVDISDDDDEEEGSSAANEGGAEAGPPCADRSEAACIKIADLLRRGRNLDGVRLAECKAYLKNIGLPQVGDIATCIERIMLHQRFKNEDPEKIYPRSSFCINCKGDVCRGDTVLFKQKIHEKSGQRNSKCMPKRIVAGKVVKESYGKERMQHTFTIQVFWSIGRVKLPPLHLLLVKGRNLYKMITFRQPWSNEAERLKALDEKHSRGDAARRSRAEKRRRVPGKGKRLLEKGKHQSQPGGRDGGSSTTKGRKRVTRSSNSDRPTKRIRKEERRASSGKNSTGGRLKAKTNSTAIDKNICTSSSYLLNVNTETDHAIQQNNMQTAPVNNGLLSKKARARKRKAALKAQSTVGGNHDQFEATRASSTSHPQACPGKSVGMHHPVSERTQRPPPFREIDNEWQPHIKGRSVSRPNPAIVLGHPNVAPAGWLAPGYFGVPPPNQPGVVFPPFNMSQTVYQRHPEGAYVMPQYR